MATAIATPAASSPAPVITPPSTVLAPKGEARAEWLKTGNMPEAPAEKPKEASAPSKETSVEGAPSQDAPAPEPGKQQEQRQRNSAESRLNEILDDLREQGLTPKALKSFKQDYQRTQSQAEPQKTAATEQTAKPAIDPKAPVKPKTEDFEGKPWAEYEAAKDKYYEDVADYKAAKAIETDRARQRDEAATRELQGKVTDAEKRYGTDAREVIRKTSTEIFSDAKVNGVVKALLNDSPVLVDVLYTIGGKAEDLTDFLETARSNPSAAIRKLVLVEKLVIEELAKGGEEAKAGAPDRGDDGKFKPAQPSTPERKTSAPPPPKEVRSTTGAAPDEVVEAYKSGNARAFIEAENRREIRKMKGF